MKKLNRNIENGNLQKPINKKIDSESIKPERDSFDQKELDTLVQTVTDHGEKMQVLVAGDGTKLSDNKVLKSRAKRKIITQSLVLSLIDIAKKKGDTKFLQALWNTYHCQEKLFTSNGRMYGQYCKNRFCTICSSIRKAEIMNKYLPELREWEDPYFVTLTVNFNQY